MRIRFPGGGADTVVSPDFTGGMRIEASLRYGE
jgi:hypothetical protein